MVPPAVELLVLDYDGVCTLADGTVDPAAAHVVDDARQRGLVVAVLSNELDDHTRRRTPLLAQVDHVVVCATGIQKPDRRAFQRVMYLAGVGPDATVVVDDSPDNEAGALAAGAVAVLFDRDDRAASWRAVRERCGLPATD